MQRPNILYLHSHDTGRFIQPYGHAVATPNLQRLAGEGVLFRQAFTVNPTCSPSRACLLTGQCAHRNGMLGLAHRGFALNDYRQHLIHTLHAQGYTSALAGVQHIAHGPDAWQTIGYRQCLSQDSRSPETAAIAWLEQPHPEPFFLSVGFADTHREFPTETPDDDPRWCLPPPPLPDTPETRLDMARFKTSARRLDAKMGAVLDALERTGLAATTLVIATTDHGIAFPRMKCNLHDSGTGVMLILRGPGPFAGGRVVDAMVSHLDLFPTLCEWLAIPAPPWLEGRSLLPLLDGSAADIHEAIHTEVNWHAALEPMRGVRTRRWKYIRRFDGRSRPVLPNCDDSPSKSVWLEHQWAHRGVDSEMLFDLVYDPNEAHNLVNDARCQEPLQEMRGRLQAWMEATDDPLLKGPLRPPPGIRVNDPDGLSPRETPQPPPA
ncbi:MAG: sulfatase [Lentisphaerae bacterium]|nr:sulfatase [Lentisphaerota bacterium]